MNKVYEFLSNAMAYVWAMLWVVIITFASFGAAVWAVKWVLRLIGVIV